jgi:hypothetical protein
VEHFVSLERKRRRRVLLRGRRGCIRGRFPSQWWWGGVVLCRLLLSVSSLVVLIPSLKLLRRGGRKWTNLEEPLCASCDCTTFGVYVEREDLQIR